MLEFRALLSPLVLYLVLGVIWLYEFTLDQLFLIAADPIIHWSWNFSINGWEICSIWPEALCMAFLYVCILMYSCFCVYRKRTCPCNIQSQKWYWLVSWMDFGSGMQTYISVSYGTCPYQYKQLCIDDRTTHIRLRCVRKYITWLSVCLLRAHVFCATLSSFQI